MGKMKTHSGAKKRFKQTGSGKLMRRRANHNHILEKKSKSRKRRLGQMTVVDKGEEPRIRRQLGV